MPMSDAIVRNALANAKSPRRHHAARYRLALSVSLIVLLASLTVVMGYYSPRFGDTLAGAPVVGDITEPLQAMGLIHAQAYVTSLSDRSTSSGYEIRLEGGYADASRTILLAAVSPAGRAILLAGRGQISLTDQFGQSYNPLAGYANAEDGQTALVFPQLSGLAQDLGARLTLKVAQLELVEGAASDWRPIRDIAGDWSLSGTLFVQESKLLSSPKGGRLGPLNVGFTEAYASPDTVEVSFRVYGSEEGQGTTAPLITATVLDDTGRPVNSLDEWTEGQETVVAWERSPASSYKLSLSDATGGSLTRTIFVRS
jgi:hypothetical protein